MTTTPACWEDGALWAAEAVRSFASVYVGESTPLLDLRHFFDWMEACEAYSSYDFIALGGRAWQTLMVVDPTMTVERAVEIVASKQRDYGPQNILRYGVDGLRIRIHDKIARLENLTKRGNLASNESVVDTWFDVVGYCIVGVLLCKQWFTLPLYDDV